MQSLEEIYQKYALRVYKYLLSLCHNEDVAEEITQETFYQAVRCIDRYDGSCAILTWLCAIAKNQFLAYRRKNPVMENLETLEEGAKKGKGNNTGNFGTPVKNGQADNSISNSAEATVMQTFDRIELMKKLHLCPEPFREVLYLRIFGNLSFREIGAMFGRSENWACVTYHRAAKMIRARLEEKL